MVYNGTKTRVRTVGRDLEYFPIVMELHHESTFSPFIFMSVMNVLTQHIQREVSWCMLFVDDKDMMDDTQGKVSTKLEV